MSAMSTPGTFEECADELNDFVTTLRRYPPTVLAFALRAHLCGLLHALRAQDVLSREELATFIAEMAQEALEGNPGPS